MIMEVIKRNARRVSEYFESITLQMGEKYEQVMDKSSTRSKYVCEVFLRVSSLFIIHQWLLFSLYTNYWIIDIFLFIMRYGVVIALGTAMTYVQNRCPTQNVHTLNRGHGCCVG